MLLNRVELKRRAKPFIFGSSPKVAYVAAIAMLLSVVINLLSNRIMGLNMSVLGMSQYMEYVENGDIEYALRMLESQIPPVSAYLINIALQLIYSVVSVGFVIFILNTIRNTAPCMGNLLDGFGMVWRIIKLNFLTYLFVALWSLLLVVPGFIAAYRYRLATYIMIDNPDMKIMDCIRESKRLTQGHKMELFVLDLSFFGWYLLGAIPILGYIIGIWTNSYVNLTLAMYYDSLKSMNAGPGYNGGNYSGPYYNGPYSN